MRVLMLAVSLDVLPNIRSRRKFKSPTRTHHISQVWARCPSEHHKVLVIYLPQPEYSFNVPPHGTFWFTLIIRDKADFSKRFSKFLLETFCKRGSIAVQPILDCVQYSIPCQVFQLVQAVHNTCSWKFYISALQQSIRKSSKSTLMSCTISVPLTRRISSAICACPLL